MALEGRRVLYISYNGMLDPLGQSQVLPYLRELSKKGVRFTLLSFERPAAFKAEGIVKRETLKQQLEQENIEWHCLRYHQTPSVPATVYDVMAGIRYARRLVKRNRIEMVHARSHIAAAIALALKKSFGLKFIFDIRGLMAEEYLDAGHWRDGGIPHRLTKTMERRTLAAADSIVTLTHRVWPVIRDWEGLRGRHVVHDVVPCCTDLELFSFRSDDRERRRGELGLENRFTVVYSGSIGGWYLSDKMADFFVELIKHRPDAHFLWLTPGDPAIIREVMDARGINDSQYTVQKIASGDVASYLSASDAGIAFYKPGPSKVATSPVKVSEYLACGLPIIINAGIGDSDGLITDEAAGGLINNFDEKEYARAVSEIERLTSNAEQTRRRMRELAERLFDVRTMGVERYARLYESVLNGTAETDNRKSPV
jgi:glycosyltransferase involved in cell wall biosynthesis